ncbi:hypothetical protein C8R43DRAFT_1018305 [Mycena crocata]|nr:hypothetical protein C8R43DRAFT_1018305 [Mycena crocata]
MTCGCSKNSNREEGTCVSFTTTPYKMRRNTHFLPTSHIPAATSMTNQLMSTTEATLLSCLADSTPISTTSVVLAVLVFIVMIVHIIVCSPPKRSRKTSSSEKEHLSAMEAGILSPSDLRTELMIAKLQIRASRIREAILRTPMPNRKSYIIPGMLQGSHAQVAPKNPKDLKACE